MRSELVLRSPSNGTGWEEPWTLSGSDESLLREHLAKLAQHLTPAPIEGWDRHGRVIHTGDRWLAAMLLFLDGIRDINRRAAHPQFQADAAWTSSGALELAVLLGDQMSDLRTSIERRFGGIAAS